MLDLNVDTLPWALELFLVAIETTLSLHLSPQPTWQGWTDIFSNEVVDVTRDQKLMEKDQLFRRRAPYSGDNKDAWELNESFRGPSTYWSIYSFTHSFTGYWWTIVPDSEDTVVNRIHKCPSLILVGEDEDKQVNKSIKDRISDSDQNCEGNRNCESNWCGWWRYFRLCDQGRCLWEWGI